MELTWRFGCWAWRLRLDRLRMTAEPVRSRPGGSGTAALPASAAQASGAPAEAPPKGERRQTPEASGQTGARPIPPMLHPHVEARPTGRRLAILSLTALGVVYGDIGTSPLYAFRECFKPEYGLPPTADNVYGVLSLMVWSLTTIVSVKYIAFIMKADNRGEGGILALLALLLQRHHRAEDVRRRALLIGLGLFGAALLYGDGMITPAISVLGAVEGLEVASPTFSHLVVPLALVILFGLFMIQRFGTARVGTLFGPLMLVWFFTIGFLGAREIAREPGVLAAISPSYAVRFFVEDGVRGFFILGAVVLVVTGAEALYADMGHFGKRPIRIAWFALVFPALLLNYFGQGALVLRDRAAAENPFYLLAPHGFIYPLLVIATLAAIIASQALISGAFSLTQQSVQLGYTPRVTIIHTSAREAGQIFIPEINKALMVGCLLIVLAFRSSSALGAAYGIAVTGTMAITTVLYFVIARQRFGWSTAKAGVITAIFLAIDLAFFSANVIKVEHGGWVPLAMATGIFAMMTTWKHGRNCLSEINAKGTLPFDLFLEDVARRKPVRVPGTAIFMTSAAEGAPVVLLHHLKHNKVLHEQVILMSIRTAEVPEIPADHRVTLQRFEHGFWRVMADYGFMQSPDVKEILARCVEQGVQLRPQDTSFYLGREMLIPTGAARMARWRKKLFIVMSRNARNATQFFGIPPNRVVELGAQIEF
jgi:KUP system potassium uptake protein